MPYPGAQPPLTSSSAKRAKTPPPEDTFEEASYLKQLGEKQKLVSIKLMDGEILRGWIEYYDKNMIRLTRENGPNLFIFKHEIMYIAEGSLNTRRGKKVTSAPESAKSESAKADAGDNSEGNGE